jgi:hypothetical protein
VQEEEGHGEGKEGSARACKALAGIDEEVVEDDDGDDDGIDEEEEEDDDIPWDELARDVQGSSLQPSTSTQVLPSPTLTSTLQGEDAGTEAMNMEQDTLLGAPSQVGGTKRQHAEEVELGSGGPTLKRPYMVASCESTITLSLHAWGFSANGMLTALGPLL